MKRELADRERLREIFEVASREKALKKMGKGQIEKRNLERYDRKVKSASNAIEKICHPDYGVNAIHHAYREYYLRRVDVHKKHGPYQMNYLEDQLNQAREYCLELERNIRKSYGTLLKFYKEMHKMTDYEMIQFIDAHNCLRWILKVYPSIFATQPGILLMSVKKFVCKFDPILLPTCYVYELGLEEKYGNRIPIVAIDESDAAMEDIADIFFSSYVCPNINTLVEYVNKIIDCTTSHQFPKMMRDAQVSYDHDLEKQGKKRETLGKISSRGKKLIDQYHLKASFIPDRSLKLERRGFILTGPDDDIAVIDGLSESAGSENDAGEYTGFNFLKVRPVKYQDDPKMGENVIYPAKSSDDIDGELGEYRLTRMATAIDGFLREFSIYIHGWAEVFASMIIQEQMEEKGQERDNRQIGFSTTTSSAENIALATILNVFSMDDEKAKAILESYQNFYLRLSKVLRKFHKQSLDASDGSGEIRLYGKEAYYMRGMETIELEKNPDMYQVVKIRFAMVHNTPNAFHAFLVATRPVLEISATGDIAPSLKNWDYEFLENFLPKIGLENPIISFSDEAKEEQLNYHQNRFKKCEGVNGGKAKCRVADPVNLALRSDREQGYKNQYYSALITDVARRQQNSRKKESYLDCIRYLLTEKASMDDNNSLCRELLLRLEEISDQSAFRLITYYEVFRAIEYFSKHEDITSGVVFTKKAAEKSIEYSKEIIQLAVKIFCGDSTDVSFFTATTANKVTDSVAQSRLNGKKVLMFTTYGSMRDGFSLKLPYLTEIDGKMDFLPGDKASTATDGTGLPAIRKMWERAKKKAQKEGKKYAWKTGDSRYLMKDFDMIAMIPETNVFPLQSDKATIQEKQADRLQVFDGLFQLRYANELSYESFRKLVTAVYGPPEAAARFTSVMKETEMYRAAVQATIIQTIGRKNRTFNRKKVTHILGVSTGDVTDTIMIENPFAGNPDAMNLSTPEFQRICKKDVGKKISVREKRIHNAFELQGKRAHQELVAILKELHRMRENPDYPNYENLMRRWNTEFNPLYRPSIDKRTCSRNGYYMYAPKPIVAVGELGGGYHYSYPKDSIDGDNRWKGIPYAGPRPLNKSYAQFTPESMHLPLLHKNKDVRKAFIEEGIPFDFTKGNMILVPAWIDLYQGRLGEKVSEIYICEQIKKWVAVEILPVDVREHFELFDFRLFFPRSGITIGLDAKHWGVPHGTEEQNLPFICSKLHKTGYQGAIYLNLVRQNVTYEKDDQLDRIMVDPDSGTRILTVNGIIDPDTGAWSEMAMNKLIDFLRKYE